MRAELTIQTMANGSVTSRFATRNASPAMSVPAAPAIWIVRMPVPASPHAIAGPAAKRATIRRATESTTRDDTPPIAQIIVRYPGSKPTPRINERTTVTLPMLVARASSNGDATIAVNTGHAEDGRYHCARVTQERADSTNDRPSTVMGAVSN